MERLDKYLVNRGLCKTDKEALAAILAGEVWLGEERLEKPGMKIRENSAISLRPRGARYVSRAGEKLEYGLHQFGILPAGKRSALDVGSSTGGFTDCLLQNGARRVFAVDVGDGQLDSKLRNDPRVTVMERTNARYLTNAQCMEAHRDAEKLSLVAVDVSFISLTKIIPAICAEFPSLQDWLTLFKPQFEVPREAIGKGGVIRDTAETTRALDQFPAFHGRLGVCSQSGAGKFSPFPGKKVVTWNTLFTMCAPQHRFKRQLSSILFFCFVLAGCAGHKTHPNVTYGPPERPEPILSANPTGVTPGEPLTPLPPPPSSEPQTPAERTHIALVLGGHGVASFAAVGLMKRLLQEGIHIDYIVATGWPAVFALGYGYLTSIHDVEWFAMRLTAEDFEKIGKYERKSEPVLSKLVESSIPLKELGETKVPVVIAATNSDVWQPSSFDRGEWKEALLETLSIPGLYRPFSEDARQRFDGLQGLSIEEAIRRSGRRVVAVDMYGDYLHFTKGQKLDGARRLARNRYINELTRVNQEQAKRADIYLAISLSRVPTDFSAKRSAMLAGAREATKIAKQLRGR